MTQLVHEIRISYAFVERNFNLVKRYWGWEVVWLAYSVANALSITFIGAGTEAVTGQAIDTNHMILYLLVGTLVWHYLAVVFDNVSEMIAWERWEGTIEYTFMAPISRFTHMVGQTLFSLVYGLLHTSIILGVVALFFRLDLRDANLFGGLLLLVAGSLSFVGLGIVASVLPLLFPERGAQMTHVIQALLLLISGVYFPVSVLLNGCSRWHVSPQLPTCWKACERRCSTGSALARCLATWDAWCSLARSLSRWDWRFSVKRRGTPSAREN